MAPLCLRPSQEQFPLYEAPARVLRQCCMRRLLYAQARCSFHVQVSSTQPGLNKHREHNLCYCPTSLLMAHIGNGTYHNTTHKHKDCHLEYTPRKEFLLPDL